MKLRLACLAVTALIAACASTPRLPEPPPSHPASPKAAQAPMRARSEVLSRAPVTPADEAEPSTEKAHDDVRHGE
jgi:hypothetical protein